MNNISYPFILGKNRQAVLYLPVDLTKRETERLANFVKTLVVEPEEESQ